MSDRAFRRLSCWLLIPLLLAVAATTTQAQDSTRTSTQQRPQPTELQRTAGVLFQGNTATPQAGFEFVKLPDKRVVVRRFGAETSDEEITCRCEEVQRTGCELRVRVDAEGKVTGVTCHNINCNSGCRARSRKVTTLLVP